MNLRAGLAVAVALSVGIIPAAQADEIDDRVRRQFQETNFELCPDAATADPQMFEVGFRDRYAAPDAPEEFVRLYQFVCLAAAYNTIHVFFMVSEFAGIQQVTFAVPDIQVDCAGGGPPGETCKAATVAVRGMTTFGDLVNATFTPATKSITSVSCGRGPCDASDRGTWVFEHGRFVLEVYDVDATYDGQINPVRVVDFTGV